MTRTSTGKLPLPRQLDLPDSSSGHRIYVNQKISTGDVKEKMEQQLRLQREANNKKRAEDLNKGERSNMSNEIRGDNFFFQRTSIQDDHQESGHQKS